MTKDIDLKQFRDVRSKSLKIKLFGKHIQHSRSPLLQNYSFKKLGLDWKYELLDSEDIDLFKQFLNSEECAGAGVTMPNKVRMLPHVDLVDDGAKAVGAINTIYIRHDKVTNKKLFIGTNTDTIGIKNSFLFNASEVVEKSKQQERVGLVYGGGGACRSAVYALSVFLGCSKVYIINRFSEEVEAVKKEMIKGGFKGEIGHIETPAQAKQLANKPLLIVCTVPDFEPQTEQEKLARETLQVFIDHNEKGAVLEMCYHPNPETRLYKDFEKGHWKVISGIEAMLYQGLAQEVLWTGYTWDELPVKEVIEYVYQHVHD
ncbi:uncharacterized protein RJT21DRAFT_117914 [Scheffersomyces amazonensis]|uniref:uncharacterized protein n=1 Tax=Scheffersomyces amazonensis TaxID=1078765 RepID=UPI00315C9398